MVYLHHARKHKPIHVRAQAADVGRKLQRQHGYSTIRKIDAGSAQAGFHVERRFGCDVVGYIGDVYLEFEVAAIKLTDEDRIIEVTRGLAVDGNNWKSAKVTPLADFSLGNPRFDALSFFQYFGWKQMWKMKLTNDDFDIDAEVVFVSQNLDDFPAWILRGRGPT